MRLLYASSLKYSRAVFVVKTFSPKIPVIFAEPKTVTSFTSVVRSLIALNLKELLA